MPIPYRYRILALLGGLSGLVAYFGRGSWAIDAFAANVAAGFIGALATVVLVDRAAEKRQESERRRMEVLALRQARMPLVQLMGVFADMIKAASASTPTPLPATYDELFRPRYTDEIDWLRLDAPAGTVTGADWYRHLHQSLGRLSELLSKVVDKYMAFARADFIEAIEEVRDDSYYHLLLGLNGARNAMAPRGIREEISLNGTKEFRDRFFTKVRHLIERYDEISESPVPLPPGWGRNDVMPKFGSARHDKLPPTMKMLGEPSLQPGEEAHWIT